MPPSNDRAPGDSRRDPRALLVLAAALLLARVGVTVWERAHPAELADLVHWVPLAKAEALARATGRPVLYAFEAAWCEPCAQLRHDVFAQKKTAAWIDDAYVPVLVEDRSREDGRNVPAVDSLERAFHLRGFPTLAVWSPRGGDTKVRDGYTNADDVRRWLESGRTVVFRRITIPPATPDTLALPRR